MVNVEMVVFVTAKVLAWIISRRVKLARFLAAISNTVSLNTITFGQIVLPYYFAENKFIKHTILKVSGPKMRLG